MLSLFIFIFPILTNKSPFQGATVSYQHTAFPPGVPPCFLAQDSPETFYTFLLLPWNPPFLQEALVPFRGKCYLGTKICPLGRHIIIRLFLVWSPLKKWSEGVYVCIHDMHAHLHTNLSLHLLYLSIYWY